MGRKFIKLIINIFFLIFGIYLMTLIGHSHSKQTDGNNIEVYEHNSH